MCIISITTVLIFVKKNAQSNVQMLNAILTSKLGHGCASKLRTVFGRHIDVQNWSWTDGPNIDMICTSI